MEHELLSRSHRTMLTVEIDMMSQIYSRRNAHLRRIALQRRMQYLNKLEKPAQNSEHSRLPVALARMDRRHN